MTPIVSSAGGRRIHSATPSTVRHVNRSIVLNLVRRHQPVSRAELSGLMGIYRSSVSDIVDELLEQGLLVERLMSPTKRGRVPIQLYLNPNGFRVLAISVRPFEAFVTVAGLDGRIERTVSFPTPRKPAQLLVELSRAVERLRALDPNSEAPPLQQVAIGIPGLVNSTDGVISMIPSLPDYAGFPIAEELRQRFGVPVLTDNDCNTGALGELWLNPPEIANVRDFVFLEIGDVGVGAGIVLGGSLYRGHDSTWVGEFGHMMMDPRGDTCRCGRRGCWEGYVSDESTWKRFDPDRPYAPALYEELLLKAAGRDGAAMRALRKTAEFLSMGIWNIQCSLNPEVILVSGEITKAWTLVEDIVRQKWAAQGLELRVRPSRMPLDQLSVQGAVALALSSVFGSPKLG